MKIQDIKEIVDCLSNITPLKGIEFIGTYEMVNTISKVLIEAGGDIIPAEYATSGWYTSRYDVPGLGIIAVSTGTTYEHSPFRIDKIQIIEPHWKFD